MKHRRGVSLIELVVVIATSSVVMSVGVWTLHMLMRSERGGAKTLISATAHARLSQQFRADVHAALSASSGGRQADDGREDLQLALPDGRKVSYRQTGDSVVREESMQQQRIRREGYRTHRGSRARFDVKEEQGTSWAILSWESDRQETETPATQSTHGRAKLLRIEALLAKDHRFEEERP